METSLENETNLRTGDQMAMKSIRFSGDLIVLTDDLPGYYKDGIQYFDLEKINYVNNTGLANLIELKKTLLEQGKELQLINVSEKIKEKIKTMGLENILYCR